MATVTHTLITLLKLAGGAQYAAEMQKAAQNTQQLANAQNQATKTGGQLHGVFEKLVGAALIGGGIKFFEEAANASAEFEQQVFRTTVVLKNLGSSLPIEKITAMADAMQASTTAASGDIIQSIGVLKRFGTADKDIESVTKAMLDFSAGAGIDLNHATVAVGHALIGNSRILRNLGVDFKATGNRAKDLIALQAKLEGLFGGAAEARRNTLQGALDVLTNSWTRFMRTVGDAMSNILVPVLLNVSKLLDAISANPVLAAAIGGAAGGAAIGAGAGLLVGQPGAGALIGGLITGTVSAVAAMFARPNAAANIGTGKDRLATEDTLAKVAENTGKMNSAISRVIGGSGAEAHRAWTLRDARMSFGI